MSFEDLQLGRTFSFNGSQSQHQHQHQEKQRQEPSQGVAAGVFQINTALASFQRLLHSLGTPKDTLLLRQKLHKTRYHIGQLVKETSIKLKQATETDQRTEVSASKKIADAKLAKDFQAVLREFQKAQRLAAERETTYAPFVPKEVLLPSNNGNELEIDSAKSHEQLALLVQSKRQEVAMLENDIVFNEAIIEEREQGIEEIQQQIDDISSNIESSHAGTAQATCQLAKASKIQRSNSSMTCLMLVIFGIILLIVVVVVVA